MSSLQTGNPFHGKELLSLYETSNVDFFLYLAILKSSIILCASITIIMIQASRVDFKDTSHTSVLLLQLSSLQSSVQCL